MRVESVSSALLLVTFPACETPPERAPASSRPESGPAFELAFGGEDEALRPLLLRCVDDVERFFGVAFPEPFTVQVLPDRAAFTASFPPEWGMAETECWMVAAGVADSLRMLSPRVWETDACEHDPGDAEHLRGIVTHELVHVLHGQRNPTRDFVGAEEVGWFAEGVATHASGQLDRDHAAAARAAVDSGLAPERLAESWSGPHRYGVTGSMARFVDLLVGREGLVELLSATTNAEILQALDRTEEEFLAEWVAFVRAGD